MLFLVNSFLCLSATSWFISLTHVCFWAACAIKANVRIWISCVANTCTHRNREKERENERKNSSRSTGRYIYIYKERKKGKDKAGRQTHGLAIISNNSSSSVSAPSGICTRTTAMYGRMETIRNIYIVCSIRARALAYVFASAKPCLCVFVWLHWLCRRSLASAPCAHVYHVPLLVCVRACCTKIRLHSVS